MRIDNGLRERTTVPVAAEHLKRWALAGLKELESAPLSLNGANNPCGFIHRITLRGGRISDEVPGRSKDGQIYGPAEAASMKVSTRSLALKQNSTLRNSWFMATANISFNDSSRLPNKTLILRLSIREIAAADWLSFQVRRAIVEGTK